MNVQELITLLETCKNKQRGIVVEMGYSIYTIINELDETGSDDYPIYLLVEE